jgi:hypothetical protein
MLPDPNKHQGDSETKMAPLIGIPEAHLACSSRSEKAIGRQRKVSGFGWAGLSQRAQMITGMGN